MAKSLGFIADAECYGCKNMPADSWDLFHRVEIMADKGGMRILSHRDSIRQHTGVPFVHPDNAGDDVLCLIVPCSSSDIVSHTWPRWNYVHIHFFTCGSTERATEAIEEFIEALQPTKVIRNYNLVGTEIEKYDPKMAGRIRLKGGETIGKEKLDQGCDQT
jgi:S-adenosylmethionine/arginine decarboxylase-like enzyme